MFTDADLLALYDDWLAADNPSDPIWFARWYDAARALSLPFYADGFNDAGTSGWAQWLADALGTHPVHAVRAPEFVRVPELV